MKIIIHFTDEFSREKIYPDALDIYLDIYHEEGRCFVETEDKIDTDYPHPKIIKVEEYYDIPEDLHEDEEI